MITLDASALGFVHGMALADQYLVTGCADRTIKVGLAYFAEGTIEMRKGFFIEC